MKLVPMAADFPIIEPDLATVEGISVVPGLTYAGIPSLDSKIRPISGTRASYFMKGETMPKPRQRKAARASTRTRVVRQTQRSVSSRAFTWWLTADVEVCTFCHQGYAYGTGFRCPGCDAAV